METLESQPSASEVPDIDSEKLNEINDVVRERISKDCLFFIQSCLSIIDKQTRKLVPFILNPVQNYYEAKRKKFNNVLKHRKGGMSTIIIARNIWNCAFKENRYAVMLGYDKDSTKELLDDKLKPLLQNCDIDLKYDDRTSQVLFPETRSKIYTGTAGTRKFGRSKDITNFHFTEGAFYEDYDVLTSIEEALTDDAEGDIETTANGMNFYHDIWERGEKGETIYNNIFIPWFLCPDYVIRGAKVESLDEEERKLVEAFRLTQEQLAWRRMKLRTMNRPELFPQEFPATAYEAFIGSGKMVFDWVSVSKHGELCCKPRLTGFLANKGDRIEFVPSVKGSLKIWETPVDDHRYVVGADVAEGVETGAFSAAFIVDLNTMEQVAEFHSRVAPDIFGDILSDLGFYYRVATLAPEAWPGPGAITANRLSQLQYPNLYHRKDKSRNDEQTTGWETTKKTKYPLVFDFAGDVVRDFEMTLKSDALLSEIRTYIYDENGDMRSQRGCYSDLLVSAEIAWQVCKEMNVYPSRKPKTLREMMMGSISDYFSIPQYHGPIYGRKPT